MGAQQDFFLNDPPGAPNIKISLSEASELIQEASRELKAEFADRTPAQLTPGDQAFSSLIDSPAGYGMLRELERYGVGGITLTPDKLTGPRDTLQSVFEAGSKALRDNGIPEPNLELYDNAAVVAEMSSRPLPDVIADMEASQPLGIRRDMDVSSDPISFDPGDTVTLGETTSFADTRTGATQAATLGAGFEPIDYTEYDVHLMAYPLKRVLDLPGESADIYTRDSHAFVVVTEKGGNPFDKNDALLVTRAGPDNGWFSGSSGTENEQSPTEKGDDGDVYVADPTESRRDMDAPGVFRLQTVSITGNIDTIRGDVAEFREFINGQDIDYRLLSRNSNTYAGDTFELLTGEEPNNPYSGPFGRRTPALDNDLINYKETDYANDFS